MQFDLFDDTQNKILESADYETFRKNLLDSNCDRCGLHQSRTHIVIDRGNPGAKILFIGEAPGENEDKQGLAFVGRAGKRLDSLMQEIGIDTNRQALIVNIVKCRPPDNRAPRAEEAGTCMRYLLRQIQLVKPHMIVLLGATALKHLVREKPDFSMEEEAGKIFKLSEFPSADFMVLFHPAYLLYDPRKMTVMRDHLQTLKRYLENHGLVPASAANDDTGQD